MSAKPEDTSCDVDMNNSSIAFDNLTILRELGNIANLVRDEDFLDLVPKAKLRRVQWAPMFKCLKQSILDDMVQELNSMWEFEGMPEKIAALESQKEKFASVEENLWRPQLGDVKSQLRAQDAANLRKQKAQLEVLAAEYDAKVNRLKKNIVARRAYLKALQLDMQKYQKKSEDVVAKVSEKINRHTELTELVIPRRLDDDALWTEGSDSFIDE